MTEQDVTAKLIKELLEARKLMKQLKAEIAAANVRKLSVPRRSREKKVVAHYTATNPNVKARPIKRPHFAKCVDLFSENRVVYCAVCREHHPVRECEYVRISALKPPEWVCRKFAKEHNLQPYIVGRN